MQNCAPLLALSFVTSSLVGWSVLMLLKLISGAQTT